ncbi:hypothetical protein GCK32_014270, partial [Trichostrongylus colubriformis]
ISFVGAACNFFVFMKIQVLQNMANPFGCISGSLAMWEALSLTLFLIYYSSVVFFDIRAQALSDYCGAFLLGAFQVALYAHVLISLNRFCAIFFPFQYGKVFT